MPSTGAGSDLLPQSLADFLTDQGKLTHVLEFVPFRSVLQLRGHPNLDRVDELIVSWLAGCDRSASDN
jgi:hypothetical protein